MRRPPHVVLSTLALALALTAGACGSDGNGATQAEDEGGTVVPETGVDVGSGSGNVSVALRDAEDTAEAGSATLTAEAGTRVRVVIQMQGATRASNPAHIHEGTCADASSEPAHELETVEEGRSETVLEGVGVDELQDGEYAIDVHASEAEGDAVIACGEIGSAGR